MSDINLFNYLLFNFNDGSESISLEIHQLHLSIHSIHFETISIIRR